MHNFIGLGVVTVHQLAAQDSLSDEHMLFLIVVPLAIVLTSGLPLGYRHEHVVFVGGHYASSFSIRTVT
jgi:hypothetical protein